MKNSQKQIVFLKLCDIKMFALLLALLRNLAIPSKFCALLTVFMATWCSRGFVFLWVFMCFFCCFVLRGVLWFLLEICVVTHVSLNGKISCQRILAALNVVVSFHLAKIFIV